MKHNVEIPIRAAMKTGFTESGEADTRVVLNPGGNLGFDRLRLNHPAFAFALAARIAYQRAHSLARRTGARDAKKALLIADLSAPGTAAASGWRLSLRAARSSAGITVLVFAVGDLFFCAEYRLFEFQGDVFAKVSPTLRSRAPTTAASAEQIPESEELAENIAEVLENASIETDPAPPGCTQPGVAKTVIQPTFLRIGEDSIGFAGLFEFFFRVRIVRIAVGMELQGKLAISAFDFLFCGPALYA
jgi:hypothetical protein